MEEKRSPVLSKTVQQGCDPPLAGSRVHSAAVVPHFLHVLNHGTLYGVHWIDHCIRATRCLCRSSCLCYDTQQFSVQSHWSLVMKLA